MASAPARVKKVEELYEALGLRQIGSSRGGALKIFAHQIEFAISLLGVAPLSEILKAGHHPVDHSGRSGGVVGLSIREEHPAVVAPVATLRRIARC